VVRSNSSERQLGVTASSTIRGAGHCSARALYFQALGFLSVLRGFEIEKPSKTYNDG